MSQGRQIQTQGMHIIQLERFAITLIHVIALCLSYSYKLFSQSSIEEGYSGYNGRFNQPGRLSDDLPMTTDHLRCSDMVGRHHKLLTRCKMFYRRFALSKAFESQRED
ncbi:hypothetical protein Smp_128910 [Schistosoma mansoni]|uniref:Secreted protein n=1 Tax=Schistosoma mansoni TaxID=6183 RepID=G4V981_SCHMA|nr:hypothetical protein Smp_128910 [Schistosoma mansoni]|eukprot:XP_018648134.1 hypothetical protein Smp_128910 [Schistosoma mansoni]